MMRRTPTAPRRADGEDKPRRRFVLAVLAAELLVALALRLAVGPAQPPRMAALALAPVAAPADPVILTACAPDVEPAGLRICAHF